MKFDPIAQGLALVNRFASAEWVHKYGMYEGAQKVAYTGSREGFKVASAVARQFKAVQQLARPQRLPTADKKPVLFDLNLTDEQQMVRDMAQRFAREVCREAAPEADKTCEAPGDFAEQFTELGLAQFAVPENLGGAASETWETTQALICEDLAHGDMGLAVAALTPVGVANAIARWGSAAQQSRYLPEFAGDNPPPATVAVNERVPAFDPFTLKTRATVNGDGFLLNGEKSMVPLADTAELFIVAVDLVGRGPCLFLLEAGTEGLSIGREATMGTRAGRFGTLKLDNVQVPDSALLGEDVAAVDYSDFIDRSHLAWCALSLGTCRAVLEYVIEYCNDREAFGEPISHRQAVAFMIANIAIELDGMRLLTWRAAARAEAGASFHREAYLAHVLCLEKAMEVGTNGVQLLGGHGFTKEHPVERWYRDLMAIGVMHGGPLL